MYTHPNLLIPALLDNTIRPFVTLATPIFIHRTMGIAEDTHPITYAAAQLCLASASLLITLPIETVRRRMQVQTRNVQRPLRACIELRPTTYYGVMDTCWRILTEERSAPVSRRRRQQQRKRSRSFKGKERATSTDGSDPTAAATAAGAASASETAAAAAAEQEAEDGLFASSGLAQLYRGFGMGLMANAVIFILGTGVGVSGEDSGSGWTEL